VSEFLKRIADFSPRRLLLLAAELEERVRSLENQNHAPIAIIGIGCRFPGGVRDAASYWELLAESRDAITEVPAWRWDADALYDPDPHAPGRVASKWGGFVDAPEFFDPAFFGIAPIEAEAMDPQQRLLLEVSWEALEDAAIPPPSLSGSRTGVWIGLCNSDYAQLTLRQSSVPMDAYFAQGASHAVAAGRISYFLGLRGPSVAIDTACSSSLVAIHQACQSLRLNETDLALAGGVNLLFTPQVTMALSRAQMMSPDGRCKPFSDDADGFVRSEGCGVVVLKRLPDAQRDGDRVVAVIRGSAVNQDGRSSGITAPNGPSQEDVIRTALADAGLQAQSIGYVEAHGTGTRLGDPIELRALQSALGQGRSPEQPIVVGSVKSNFGHAESAAGVAGLIKLALCLDRRQIPASLHFQSPNSEVERTSHCLRIPTALEPWTLPPGSTERIGAVSSFGFSGTNAHLVLSQAPDERVGAPGVDGPSLFLLSAHTCTALKAMAAQLADRLREDSTLRLSDVAWTLATGRACFNHRAAIRAESKDQLIEDLILLAGEEQGQTENGAWQEAGFSRGQTPARKPRVAFLFAGQGGEHSGMGLSLLEHSRVFRAAVSEVDQALTGLVPTRIETIFRNEHDELALSALVQPALFAFQFGMARMWQSWGVEPHIVVGHSMGQVLACVLAGVLSVADAARLIAARGRTTGELGDPGGMVAVAGSEDEVLAALRGYEADVSIAAINGPSSVVISGRAEPLEQATQAFERAGFRVKRLNITYGSHSPAMQRVLPAFYQEAAQLSYHAPRLTILADLTGEPVTDASTFNAQYFTSHLSRPVQFHRCLTRLRKEGCDLAIEMGPRAVLTAFGRERDASATRWIASANGREPDFVALQSALAQAFVAGAPLDWKAVLGERGGRKITLPTYPFERERYWIAEEVEPAPALPKALSIQSTSAHGIAGVRLDASLPIFATELQSPLPLHLEDHRVGSQVVVPASFYLSLAWSAFQATQADSAALQIAALRITDLAILRPMQPGKEGVSIQTTLSPLPEKSAGIRISSRRPGEPDWTLHATGHVHQSHAPVDHADPGAEPSPALHSSFDRSTAQSMRGEDFYQRLDEQEVHLTGAFRAIQQMWYQPGAAQALIVWDEALYGRVDASPAPHPALLDTCFQVLGAAAVSGGDARLRLMTSIQEFHLLHSLRSKMLVEAQLVQREGGVSEGSLLVFDAVDGTLVASANGILLRPLAAQVSAQTTGQTNGEDWLYEQTWQPAPFADSALAGSASLKNEPWLILGSPAGIAAAVVDRLISRGQDACLIENQSTIPELDRPHHVVDLRTLNPRTDEAGVPEQDSAILGQRAVDLLSAAVDLWRSLGTSGSRLWLFTSGAQADPVLSQDALLQSTLWGFARCATLEDPQRLERVVDLDPREPADVTVSLIVEELLSSNTEEQVAYAGSERRAFRLQALPQRAAENTLPVLRMDGCYLLTGGLGGLGLRVAEWLGQTHLGKLILVTRSQDSIAARQIDLDQLRAQGVDFEVVPADIADPQAMQSLFARFGSDLPPLRGIVHMAADISAAPMATLAPESIRSMVRAKVNGTWLLHQLSQSQPLDFFVAFSTSSALLGASNFAHYAAANSFLDAMASFRAAQNLPYNSIRWGTWATMRLAGKNVQQQYTSSGMLPMSDEIALRWLGTLMTGAIMHENVRNAMVARIDWSRLAPLYEARRTRHWLEYIRLPLTSLGPSLASPSTQPLWIAEPGESRLEALQRAVRQEAARVLGFRRGQLPGAHDRLADLGLDSLMAVNLRNRLQALIGHTLSPTFAFEYPTPAQMAMALDLALWGSGVIEEHAAATERDEIQI